MCAVVDAEQRPERFALAPAYPPAQDLRIAGYPRRPRFRRASCARMLEGCRRRKANTPLGEYLPCATQPRCDRALRYAQALGNVRHGHLLELVEEEDEARVSGQFRERLFQHRSPPELVGQVLGVRERLARKLE